MANKALEEIGQGAEGSLAAVREAVAGTDPGVGEFAAEALSKIEGVKE